MINDDEDKVATAESTAGRVNRAGGCFGTRDGLLSAARNVATFAAVLYGSDPFRMATGREKIVGSIGGVGSRKKIR
jgi:hypothetical protein